MHSRPAKRPRIESPSSDNNTSQDEDYMENDEDHDMSSDSDSDSPRPIHISNPPITVRHLHSKSEKKVIPIPKRKGDYSRDTTGIIRFPNINRDLPNSSDAEDIAEEGDIYNEADIRLFARCCAMNPNLPISAISRLFHAQVSVIAPVLVVTVI